MNNRRLLVAAMATGLAWAPLASAGPMIGFDPNGGGGGIGGADWVFADVWDDLTDTGVDVKETGSPNPTEFVPGDVHSFHTQLRVSAFQKSGVPVTPTGLNSTFELTKEIAFRDEVTAFTASVPPSGDPNVQFGNLGDILPGNLTNPGQLAAPHLKIYRDDISDGTQALPGDGTGLVKCYGSNTNGNCPIGGGVGGVDGDGTPILEGTLFDADSSFTGTPTQGTGSFDLIFAITSHNAAWLNIDNLVTDGGTGMKLFGVRITGTLNIPTQFTPEEMWDGTALAGHTGFKITSSELFIPTVPEPSTVLLLGVGMIGVARLARKRKAA